jgi:hypothetical protein
MDCWAWVTVASAGFDLVVLDRIGAKSFRNMLVRSFIKI